LFIYSIKSRFLANLIVAAAEVSVHSRAATVKKEEAGVEAAVEETVRVESGGEETDGDLEFWDESEITWGRLLFIGSKISAAVVN
jgi:hypothetical protein